MNVEVTEPVPSLSSASPESPRSQLALRRVAIDTWQENVAFLHRDCAVYRAEGFQALSKVEIQANEGLAEFVKETLQNSVKS